MTSFGTDYCVNDDSEFATEVLILKTFYILLPNIIEYVATFVESMLESCQLSLRKNEK